MVKYPLGIQNKKRTVTHKNRGMSLESLINKTNLFYLENNIAVVYKKATPIKIFKVNNSENRITSAVFSKHSTTDYNGIYNGKYLDFEAKSTNSRTSFPIENFQDCQLDHFRRIIKQKGLAFVIFCFNELEEYYFLTVEWLFNYLENNKKSSIPLTYIKEKGFKIPLTLNPPLDYIKIVDMFF